MDFIETIICIQKFQLLIRLISIGRNYEWSFENQNIEFFDNVQFSSSVVSTLRN